MPKLLTEEQIERFNTQGAIAPVKVMESDEAFEFRKQFEALEAEIGAEAQSRFRIKAHLPFPWLIKLIKNSNLLWV